jgi:hypothetical protein
LTLSGFGNFSAPKAFSVSFRYKIILESIRWQDIFMLEQLLVHLHLAPRTVETFDLLLTRHCFHIIALSVLYAILKVALAAQRTIDI